MDTIYQELILDLNRNPLNKQKLSDFDVCVKESNPLCGDQAELFIKYDNNGKVENVGFQGNGCAVSQAALSVLTEQIKGKTKDEILALTPNDLQSLLGLQNLNPTRLRCLSLGLKALQKNPKS